MISLSQQIGNVLWRVARSMPRRHEHFAKCKSIAIFYLLRCKSVLCAAFSTGVNFGRFKSRTKFARTTHQVGVNMRLKNVRDGHAGFTRRLDVNIAVRARVKHSCDSFIVIADQIGKLCDPFGLNSFKN